MDTPGGNLPGSNRNDGALERFLASAIATILTIIFSWRLLLKDDAGMTERRSIAMEESTTKTVAMATQGSDADDEFDDDTSSVTSGPLLDSRGVELGARHHIISSPDTASYYTVSSPDSEAYEDARDVLSPVPLHSDVTKYYVRSSLRSPGISSPDTEYYSCQSHEELSDDGIMATRGEAPVSTIHYDPIHGMLDATFDRATFSDDDSDATIENNEPEDSSEEDSSFSGGMEEYFMEGTAINDSSSESEYGVIFESHLDRITEEESDQLSSSGRSNADIDSAPEEPHELPLGQSPPRTSMINTARPLIIGPYTDRSSQFSRDNVISQDSPGTSPNQSKWSGMYRDEGSGDDTPVVEQLPDWMRAYPRTSTESSDNSPGGVNDAQRHVGDITNTTEHSSADEQFYDIANEDLIIPVKASLTYSKTATSPESNNSSISDFNDPVNAIQTPEDEKPMVGTVSKIRQRFETGNVNTGDNDDNNTKEGNYTFTIFKPSPAPANKQDKATQKTFKRGQSPSSADRVNIADNSGSVNNEFVITPKTNGMLNNTAGDCAEPVLSDLTMDMSTSGSARSMTSKLTLDLSPGHVTRGSSVTGSEPENEGSANASNDTSSSNTITRGRPATKSIPPWRSIRASTSPAYQDSHLSSPSDVKPPRGFSFVETQGEETEYSIRMKNRYKYDGETPLVKSKSEGNLNFEWSTTPSDDSTLDSPTNNRYSWGPEGDLGNSGTSSGSLGDLSGNLSLTGSALSNTYGRLRSHSASVTPTGGSPEHYSSNRRSVIITRSVPGTAPGTTSVFRRNIHTQRPAVRRKPLDQIAAEVNASRSRPMTLRRTELSKQPNLVTMTTNASADRIKSSDITSHDLQQPLVGSHETASTTRPLGIIDRTNLDINASGPKNVDYTKNSEQKNEEYSSSSNYAYHGPDQFATKTTPGTSNASKTNTTGEHQTHDAKQQANDLDLELDPQGQRWAIRRGQHGSEQGALKSEYITQVKGLAEGWQAAAPLQDPYPQNLPQTVTASATSTALARRASTDGLDELSSDIVSAVGQAEATGLNPYVAVARATARAASLASANATAGVASLPLPSTSPGHPAEVSVVISTSCRVNADDTKKLQRESKELIESLGQQVQYRVHRPESDLKAIEGPIMPVTFGETKILNPEDEGPRVMTIVIQLPGNDAQKVTCEVPVNGNNDEDISSAVSAAVKSILTDVVDKDSHVAGSQLNKAVDRVTRQVLRAYSSDVSEDDSQSSQDSPKFDQRRINSAIYNRDSSGAKPREKDQNTGSAGQKLGEHEFKSGGQDRKVFYVKGTNPGLFSGAQNDVVLQVGADKFGDKHWQPNVETVVFPRNSGGQNEAGYHGVPSYGRGIPGLSRAERGIPGASRSETRGIPHTGAAPVGWSSKHGSAVRPTALAMQDPQNSKSSAAQSIDDALSHRERRQAASYAARQPHGYVQDAVRRYSSPNDDFKQFGDTGSTAGTSSILDTPKDAESTQETPKKPIKGILKLGKDVNTTELGLGRFRQTDLAKTRPNTASERPTSAPVNIRTSSQSTPKPPVPAKPSGIGSGQRSEQQGDYQQGVKGVQQSPGAQEKKPYDSVLLKPFEDKRTPFYITKQLEDPPKEDILNCMDKASKVLDAKNTFYSANRQLPVMATPKVDTYDKEFEMRKQKWANKPPIPAKNNVMVVDIDIDSRRKSGNMKKSSADDVRRKLSTARPRAPPPNPMIESAWQAGVLKAARSHDRALNVAPISRKGSASSVNTTDSDGNIRKAKSLNTLPCSFFKDRSSYTSLLETDLDTLEHTKTPLVIETDLDDVLGPKAKSMSNLNSPAKWLGRHYVEEDNLDKHHSMDMLNAGYPHTRRRLDSDRSNDSRDSGDLSPDRCISETELRIVTSLNKLSLPDWYRSSIRKSRESLSILQQNNRSRKGSWSEYSEQSDSRPESRTMPSTPTHRPVVIRHRVSTFVRASPPKDAGVDPDSSFELPSTKLRESSPVKLKRMEIKPIETIPAPMSRSEPGRESAREQYLRLRSRSRSSSLTRSSSPKKEAQDSREPSQSNGVNPQYTDSGKVPANVTKDMIMQECQKIETYVTQTFIQLDEDNTDKKRDSGSSQIMDVQSNGVSAEVPIPKIEKRPRRSKKAKVNFSDVSNPPPPSSNEYTNRSSGPSSYLDSDLDNLPMIDSDVVPDYNVETPYTNGSTSLKAKNEIYDKMIADFENQSREIQEREQSIGTEEKKEKKKPRRKRDVPQQSYAGQGPGKGQGPSYSQGHGNEGQRVPKLGTGAIKQQRPPQRGHPTTAHAGQSVDPQNQVKGQSQGQGQVDYQSHTIEDVIDGLLSLPPSVDNDENFNRKSRDRHVVNIDQGGSPKTRAFKLLRYAHTTQDQDSLPRDHVDDDPNSVPQDPAQPGEVNESTVAVVCRNPKCRRRTVLNEARRSYKTCHNCFTYYCSRECRKVHWERHKQKCLFSRINSACKHVIRKVHDEMDVLDNLTKLAKSGYLSKGRGCVLMVFPSPEKAMDFLRRGIKSLDIPPAYVNVQDIQRERDIMADHVDELVAFCKSYNPDIKLVLEVAIVAGEEFYVPSQPHPRRQGPAIKKCAKLRLITSNVQQPKSRADPETLILTAVPGSEFTENMDERKAREICFANIHQKLLQRGVTLRQDFPDVYTRLCSYVTNKTPFAPITIYPFDRQTGRKFMCVIMPNSEPEVEWMYTPDLLEELGLSTAV